MAKLCQCAFGHYYDPNLYTSCPICNEVNLSIDRGMPNSGQVAQNVSEPSYEGKITVPLREEEAQIEGGYTENKTTYVSYDGQNDSAKYVVGWLAGVQGPYRGKSFEVFSKNTSIGRKRGDIVLSKDSAVSSENNMTTVYDARHNQFYLSVGHSTNHVYVDDILLLPGQNTLLRPYATIELGLSKFIFVPLCSEHFSWENEPEKQA